MKMLSIQSVLEWVALFREIVGRPINENRNGTGKLVLKEKLSSKTELLLGNSPLGWLSLLGILGVSGHLFVHWRQ